MVRKALKGPVSREFKRGVNLFYYVPLRQAVRPLASEVEQCHREPVFAARVIDARLYSDTSKHLYDPYDMSSYQNVLYFCNSTVT